MHCVVGTSFTNGVCVPPASSPKAAYVLSVLCVSFEERAVWTGTECRGASPGCTWDSECEGRRARQNGCLQGLARVSEKEASDFCHSVRL